MMLVDDLILFILPIWVVPLLAFVFYAVTAPLPGRRFARRWMGFRQLRPVMRIIVAQKIGLALVVSFIFAVRFTGSFPGREWVALGLYTILVALAWVITIYLRRLQLPAERTVRNLPR